MSLDDLTSTLRAVLYRQLGRTNGYLQSTQSLPVDVLESDHAYRVVFDAPGAHPDDVQVRYVDGGIRVHIDRFREYRDEYEVRYPGRGLTLEGDVDLPEDAAVDPDAGAARLTESGTLRIDIPKSTGGETPAEDVSSEDEPSPDRESESGADAASGRDRRSPVASSEGSPRGDGLQIED